MPSKWLTILSSETDIRQVKPPISSAIPKMLGGASQMENSEA